MITVAAVKSTFFTAAKILIAAWVKRVEEERFQKSHTERNRTEWERYILAKNLNEFNISLFAFRNDSQTNSEKKDPNIEEEESSNDDLKTKQRGKKSGTRKAAVKEEEQAEDDDHGTMSLNFAIIVDLAFTSLHLIVICSLISPMQRILCS